MAERPQNPQRPGGTGPGQPGRSGDPRSYGAGVAVFATMLYAALLIAVFGVITLYTGRPVVDEAGVDQLTPAVSVAAATVVLFLCLFATGWRIPQSEQRLSLARALLIAVLAYLAYAVIGALAVLLGAADPVLALLYLGAQLVGVFGVVAGIVAFLIAVCDMLMLASHGHRGGPPQWPWEKDDDHG